MAVAVTQRSVRVQFEVRTDELLTLGNGVDLIAQTTVLLVEQVGISKGISLGSRLASIDLRVVQLLISQLVVLSGIFDDVVLWNQARVATPLGVEADLGVLVAALLGGDKHNTVGTTGTVDS